MSTPQTQTATPAERTFGTDGTTETETEATEVDATEAETTDADVGGEAAKKIRIGDREFDTQQEALEYAEGLVAQPSEVDAYRQLLRETIASSTTAPKSNVAEPELDDTAELYTNPAEYLRRRDERIKQEVLGTITQSQAQRESDERIWMQFKDRHPDLSEWRGEVTSLAEKHAVEVQNLIKTKGQAAAFDYVATKFKAYASRVSEAIKPARELRKTGSGGAAGSSAGQNVTPKESPKKPATMADQIRNMRKGR